MLSLTELKELSAARREIARLYREEGRPVEAINALAARVAELRAKELRRDEPQNMD